MITNAKVGDKLTLVDNWAIERYTTVGMVATVTSSFNEGDGYVYVEWPEYCRQSPGGYQPHRFVPLKAAAPAKKKGLTPQAQQVLDMLKSAGRITGVQAWNVLKVRSLPRRIADLKEAGYTIQKAMKQDHLGQRYAEYTLG